MDTAGVRGPGAGGWGPGPRDVPSLASGLVWRPAGPEGPPSPESGPSAWCLRVVGSEGRAGDSGRTSSERGRGHQCFLGRLGTIEVALGLPGPARGSGSSATNHPVGQHWGPRTRGLGGPGLDLRGLESRGEVAPQRVGSSPRGECHRGPEQERRASRPEGDGTGAQAGGGRWECGGDKASSLPDVW